MRENKPLFPLVLIGLTVFAFLFGSAVARMQEEDPPVEKGITNSVYAEDNEQCLKCHGGAAYLLTDTISGKQKVQQMCTDNQINRDKYYDAAHWNFACTDCHDELYSEFPHPLALRFNDYWACIDCHGGDENYAQYHFEDIEAEHMMSVHYERSGGEFNCWECHDPHSYKPLVRSTASISEAILTSNNMCLECHGNVEKFALLSEKELGNVVPKHDWLPNQQNHFRSVRCIECHSHTNDSILVAHNILPSEKAVKNCIECHSSNSILMGTLYKHQARETRKEMGFINGVILGNDAYVIGANRCIVLNIASLIIFGLVLGAVAVHTALRILLRKNK
jgi:hypothetical protein